MFTRGLTSPKGRSVYRIRGKDPPSDVQCPMCRPCRLCYVLSRLALQALGGGDLDAAGTVAAATDAPTARTPGLRRTILFSLAHCCSKRRVGQQASQSNVLFQRDMSRYIFCFAYRKMLSYCEVLGSARNLIVRGFSGETASVTKNRKHGSSTGRSEMNSRQGNRNASTLILKFH